MALFATEKTARTDRTPTVIGNQDRIKGLIQSESDVLIDGRFEGEIYARGTISIIEGGSVQGDFHAQQIVVSGSAEGTLRANQVVVKTGGRIRGDIAYRILVIEEHGIFDGNCTMLPEDIVFDDAQREPAAPATSTAAVSTEQAEETPPRKT